ncbi:MAG: glycosyltransferase family 39 protein [Chloroflexi bacterium]|nr:glycosyltransferase family 39 protein [Chloroflexota bacterium]
MTEIAKKVWMRLDWSLIGTLALCLFALLPLATPDIVHGHDTLLHAHRMAEMQRSWAHGLLLPTWAETFYYGYGSPVFHYYSPLAYYFGAAAMTLGADVVSAIRLLIALSLLGAGLGMYLFGRALWGGAGGMLAALCYGYSPYLLYTEPYTRGDYPELLAFTVFPFVMWRFERLLGSGRGRDLLWAALSIVPLVLSHNLMAVALFALLVGWLLWRALFDAAVRRRALWLFVAAALGVGLMAYFWLPVALERDAVRIANVQEITADRRRNFFEFFIPAQRLFGLSAHTDAGAANGIQMHLNMGVGQWGLAALAVIVVGCAAVFRRVPLLARAQYAQMAFFALSALAMLFLMLPAAYGIWVNFTPLNYMVFPWRFLGPLAFCLAALAGMNALWLRALPKRAAHIAYAGMLLLPLALALPLLYIPPRDTAPLETSVAAYLRGERDGSISLGTTAYNEFLPATVYIIPGPTQRLVDELSAGYPPDPAQRGNLPSGVTLQLLEHNPERSVWQVQAETDFRLEVLIFYFAGWRAEIDGQPVTITPSEPHGLITLLVPAGEHHLTLWLGSTPVRDVANTLSLLSVAAMIAVVLVLERRAPVVRQIETPSEPLLPQWGALAAGIAQCALLLLFYREGSAWLNSPPGQALPARYPAAFQLGDQMRLLGYDLSSSDVYPGAQIEIVLYWYAPQPPAYTYASFVHISGGGPPLAQLDKPRLADRPASGWTRDGYLLDRYIITLPENMPPGEYQILVGVYTCEMRPAGECGNGDRLIVLDAQGRALGDSVPLATLRVR